jgi:hypothetical protein
LPRWCWHIALSQSLPKIDLATKKPPRPPSKTAIPARHHGAKPVRRVIATTSAVRKLADPVIVDPVIVDPVIVDPVIADPVIVAPVIVAPVIADPVIVAIVNDRIAVPSVGQAIAAPNLGQSRVAMAIVHPKVRAQVLAAPAEVSEAAALADAVAEGALVAGLALAARSSDPHTRQWSARSAMAASTSALPAWNTRSMRFCMSCMHSAASSIPDQWASTAARAIQAPAPPVTCLVRQWARLRTGKISDSKSGGC